MPSREYNSIITELPFCFACGRSEEDRPKKWHAPWRMERAHVAAGSSKMSRILDRRAIVVLCSLCHRAHATNDGEPRNIIGMTIPVLTNANTLWLKREFDFDWWDADWLSSNWSGLLPVPQQVPQWYLAERERLNRKRQRLDACRCQSCGDLIVHSEVDLPPKILREMEKHCLSCSKELLGIAVPIVGTLQHGTGGGQRVIRDSKTL